MPTPRKSLICIEETPYYHVVSRVVRRSFLCGVDLLTGKSYEHRRAWVEERMLLLSQVFAIDICAFAVMSNHTHIVLHVDASKARSWSMDEVLERWHQLHKGTPLVQHYLQGDVQHSEIMKIIRATAELYRNRLMDISWFMRDLNEYIAREANKEEQCSGRFWEGRFKSQALLDERALAACMAYVDLNPIRAKMAQTPETSETSEHTSIKLRVTALKKEQQPKQLLPFVGNPKEPMPQGLPFDLMHYIELVERTGRIIRDDKRGHIDIATSPILQRLDIEGSNWLELTLHFEALFANAVGDVAHLQQHKHYHHRQRCHDMASARRWLSAS